MKCDTAHQPRPDPRLLPLADVDPAKLAASEHLPGELRAARIDDLKLPTWALLPLAPGKVARYSREIRDMHAPVINDRMEILSDPNWVLAAKAAGYAFVAVEVFASPHATDVIAKSFRLLRRDLPRHARIHAATLLFLEDSELSARAVAKKLNISPTTACEAKRYLEQMRHALSERSGHGDQPGLERDVEEDAGQARAHGPSEVGPTSDSTAVQMPGNWTPAVHERPDWTDFRPASAAENASERSNRADARRTQPDHAELPPTQEDQWGEAPVSNRVRGQLYLRLRALVSALRTVARRMRRPHR